ncbi:MAG TPA: class I SAM-dependent methyltransferase [Caldilineaceae bacterium]|nr:class I SAM-dependent methyltransferase [Caldilineaceae bacterium]
MDAVTKDIKQSVQSQFGSVAANYATSTVHAKGADLEAMLTAVPLIGNEQVLDAGTGTGHTALAFARQTARVVAVDFTENMLGQGRQLAAERGITNVDFRLGDVEQLPADDGAFDLVVSRYSAHHWPHPQQALCEFVRVLKPGGTLILNDIVSYDDLVCDTYLQTIELLRDPSHVRDHSVAQWQGMIAAAGFVESTVIYQGDVYIDFLNWTERMATPAANVQLIRTLFDGAPVEFRTVFKIEGNHNFCFTGAVIRATRP